MTSSSDPSGLIDPFGLTVWSDKEMDKFGDTMSKQDAWDTYKAHDDMLRGPDADRIGRDYIKKYRRMAYERWWLLTMQEDPLDKWLPIEELTSEQFFKKYAGSGEPRSGWDKVGRIVAANLPYLFIPEMSPGIGGYRTGGPKPTLPNDALVVRGGINTPELLEKGMGTHPEGYHGVSVESYPGKTVAELVEGRPIPNKQIGVTTVGEVRAAGGDVIPTAGQSPYHATCTGLKPQKLSELLNPPRPNPRCTKPGT